MINEDNTEKGSPKFGLNSSYDLFEKLLHDSKRLSFDWNHYDAFNFLVTSWHLFNDWYKCEPKGELSRNKRYSNKLPEEMLIVLNVTKDLVNSSKHFILDKKNKEGSKIQKVHNGKEAGWFSYFFHEDTYGVSVDGGWYFSIRVLHNIIVSYFKWVFENPNPTFPKELLEEIKYCNISLRGSR